MPGSGLETARGAAEEFAARFQLPGFPGLPLGLPAFGAAGANATLSLASNATYDATAGATVRPPPSAPSAPPPPPPRRPRPARRRPPSHRGWFMDGERQRAPGARGRARRGWRDAPAGGPVADARAALTTQVPSLTLGEAGDGAGLLTLGGDVEVGAAPGPDLPAPSRPPSIL